MSLVDYASSSDEEEEERKSDPTNKQQLPHPLPSPLLHQRPRLPSDEQPKNSHSSDTPILKLPDASLLLDASNVTSHLVSGFDHSSRVASALAESASRKREANGSTNVLPRGKVPRGNLPHSRSVPDTGKGLLVPPQLSGRSNVVTEDISKLFSRKNGETRLNRSENPL